MTNDVSLAEIGRVGLTTHGGNVYEEKLRALQDPRKRNLIYKEMADNDPIVGSVLTLVETLIRQVEWKVEPWRDEGAQSAEPDKADVDVAAFVDSCLRDMAKPWRNTVSEFLSFLTFGWSWHEIVFKRRNGHSDNPLEPSSRYVDGMIGWHKFAPRSQDTLSKWLFGPHGEVLGMVQDGLQVGSKEVVIPRTKSLHFRTTSRNDNPEGKSILRNSYRPWFLKKSFEEIQAIGIERDLAGVPVLYVPEELMRQNLSASERELRSTLEEILRNLRRGEQEGIILPRRSQQSVSGQAENIYELELLTSGGRRQHDVKGVLEYYDLRIALMAVADFMLLGHEAVGSYALADSKTSLFALATIAWLDIIADEVNSQAIPQLLRVNGMDYTRSPKLVHGDVAELDLKSLAEYLERLNRVGFEFADSDELRAHLLGLADLPGDAQL